MMTGVKGELLIGGSRLLYTIFSKTCSICIFLLSHAYLPDCSSLIIACDIHFQTRFAPLLEGRVDTLNLATPRLAK